MLSLSNIKVHRNEKDILSILEYKFDLKKRYHIYGSTGAGKTTLFELLAGIEKPISGDVCVGDLSLYDSGFADLSLLRKSFGVMFDIPGLISNQNVYENIKLAVDSKNIKFKKSLRKIIIDSFLTPFDMEDIIDTRPGLLSIDQKRIAAFIRAIITKPSFLIFDGFTDFLVGPYRSQKINFLDSLYKDAIGGVFLSKEIDTDGMDFDYCLELKNGCLHEC